MSNFCTKCGKPYNEGDNVCTNCGNPIGNVNIYCSVDSKGRIIQTSGKATVHIFFALLVWEWVFAIITGLLVTILNNSIESIIVRTIISCVVSLGVNCIAWVIATSSYFRKKTVTKDTAKQVIKNLYIILLILVGVNILSNGLSIFTMISSLKSKISLLPGGDISELNNMLTPYYIALAIVAVCSILIQLLGLYIGKKRINQNAV